MFLGHMMVNAGMDRILRMKIRMIKDSMSTIEIQAMRRMIIIAT